MTDLEDYLYEPEQSAADKEFKLDIKQLFQKTTTRGQYQDINSAKRFDFLDFIIINVPPEDLPWMQKCQQITQLFKQCKYTNKLMIAAG